MLARCWLKTIQPAWRLSATTIVLPRRPDLNILGENATGITITGDGNEMNIAGDMTVDGENAVGTKVAGHNATISQKVTSTSAEGQRVFISPVITRR